MPQTGITYPIPGMLQVTIVIAVSGIVAIAIAAWLVHQVARRAIDKASPEGVPQVILALAALLYPLRSFVPWSSRSAPDRPSLGAGDTVQASLHNETSPDMSQETQP